VIEVPEDTCQALQSSFWEMVTVCERVSDELDPGIGEEVLDAAKDGAAVLSYHHAARKDYSGATVVAVAVECRQCLVSNR
jgi:hypothetical protein